MDGATQPILKRRHIAAVALGNALEFYDFLIYAFFAIQIGQAFFPSDDPYASLMLSLATFGAGFLTRPLGALVLGHYADKVGRRPALTLSFILIGVSTAALALTPTYAQIGIAAPLIAVAARLLQGFSLGGELGSNAAYLHEAAAPAQRGFLLALQNAGQSAAVVAGSLVGFGVTTLLPPDALALYGWRIALGLGLLTVPVGLWIRRQLPETLDRPEAATPATRPQVARTLIAAFVILGTSGVGAYVMNYFVTYAQGTLAVPAQTAFVAQCLSSAFGIFFTLAGGWLTDRVGRRPVMIWTSLALIAAIYPTYLWMTASPTLVPLITGLTILWGLLLLPAGAIFASITEGLPKRMRSRGLSLAYALAVAAFGATTQLAITWLIHETGSAMAPAWYLLAAMALRHVAILTVRETAPVKA